ncbi:hypothetical protein T08_8363, partial [Trichinella sp. T8]
MRRLRALRRQLNRDPEKDQEYSGVIRDYLDRGWAEKVDGTSGPPGRTWYLPHHAVYQHNQGKTKCRMVLDGSAEWNGTSLNNCLDPGPKLQPDLVAVLLRFRRSRIALQADIEKMYLQVRLRLEDRYVFRFLFQERDCGARRWKPFVANRVQEILSRTEPSQWRHSPTADNPADKLSRGCALDTLREDKLWWNGPAWLKE